MSGGLKCRKGIEVRASLVPEFMYIERECDTYYFEWIWDFFVFISVHVVRILDDGGKRGLKICLRTLFCAPLYRSHAFDAI